jgi:uncharacterized membrane protein YbhN (UPF0104 family)
MSKKLKYFFNYFLIPILFVWLAINLYQQIIHQHNKTDAWETIKNAFVGTKSGQLFLAIFFMFINWGIEAKKWQILMLPLQKINFYTAYKAIFAGTSFAANTPNRVGEYVGRMLYIEEGKRLQSIPLTITGSFSQLIVTLVAGTIALLWYIPLNSQISNPTISSFWLKVFASGSVFVSIFSLLIFFKLQWVVMAFSKIPFINKYEYFFKKVDELDNTIIIKILCLSIFRYIVFIIQYILVLNAFGIETSIFNYIILLSVLFLVMSIVPSFVIIEAGIRSTVSIELFKVITSNTAAIIATSTFIWLLNLMLPAILGVILLLGKRIFKR